MDEAQAISLVTEWIQWRGLDYPTDDLVAERFEVGWSVFAPVDIDESDPIAFLEMPVGRSVFLVGDSGRIEESSSSVLPGVAEAEFTAQERSMQRTNGGIVDSESLSDVEWQGDLAASEGSSATSDPNAPEAVPPEEGTLNLDAGAGTATDADASALIEPIVQQLGELGPAGWEQFSAEFAFTATSEIAQLRFWSADRTGLVPVPQSMADLVRLQREAAAGVPEGPWWRLVLNCTNRGEASVHYDYGVEPFPEGQLVPPEHYRNDLEKYPRSHVPVWLAGYIAGAAAQGRDPRRAAAEADGIAEGRGATAAAELPALGELWSRWAVLSAACAGVGSESGPHVHPGYAWYESEDRSGSSLFMLPGDRAVLSGGKWNSELLESAYNGGGPLPDLYNGAPGWVNDSVLNTRNRNGQLSFCFWWANGQWWRGLTDTSGELDTATPAIITADETARAMLDHTGPGTEDQCAAILTAAANQAATREDVAALFANNPDADIDAAVNQLSLAGVLVT